MSNEDPYDQQMLNSSHEFSKIGVGNYMHCPKHSNNQVLTCVLKTMEETKKNFNPSEQKGGEDAHADQG